MVSLGPLNSTAYCPIKCPFCYVQGPFPRYSAESVDGVLKWLRERASEFDIIYVSGDTDSFARPRTRQGLDLLTALAAIDCDVLFTTRHVFDQDARAVLESLSRSFADRGRLLIGCASICQLTHPALEPRPIPSPAARFEQLAWYKSVGISSVLTIRPFIRTVAPTEYVEIARLGLGGCDVVLGGDLYLDEGGVIADKIERALGVPLPPSDDLMPLDFTEDDHKWGISHAEHAERLVSDFCQEADIPFFMRSGPLVDFLRGTGTQRETGGGPAYDRGA